MGELRKLRFGTSENVITPYTAADNSVVVNESGHTIKVNTNIIATKDSVDLVRDDLTNLEDRVEDIGIGLYGAKWDQLANKLKRLHQAHDITTDTSNFGHFGSVNQNYENPFDSIYPWSEMFVCNVDMVKYRSGSYSLKECISAAYGDPDFTYVGTVDRFVGRYRPEFWYKSAEDDDGNVYYYVSQFDRHGFTHAPERIDGISFCIDAGDNKVTTGSGIPLTNITVAQIHARAKESGFTLHDIHSIDEIIILYLVEYANMNAQEALGDGCSSCFRENAADTISNVSVRNGETTFTINDSAMGQYMQVGCQIDIGTAVGAVTYRGLIKSYTVSGSAYTITLDRELAISNGMIASVHGFSACEYDMIGASVGNASGYIGVKGKANVFYRGAQLFGNRYSYILGIYREHDTNRIWLCPDNLDPDDYDALNTTVHKDTGVSLPVLETGDWQTVGGNAQRLEGVSAFMVTGISQGNSASPVGDRQWVPENTRYDTILLFGCSAGNGWACGVFGGNWYVTSGYSYWLYAGLPVLKQNPL